jgi:hypothetical protein
VQEDSVAYSSGAYRTDALVNCVSKETNRSDWKTVLGNIHNPEKTLRSKAKHVGWLDRIIVPR